MDSDKHTGLIKVVHYGPVVGVTHLVREVMCSILGELTEAKKKLCNDQFCEGIRHIHTQPTNSRMKNSLTYYIILSIRYKLQINKTHTTDAWEKLRFRVRSIVFYLFYFMVDRTYSTNHLVYLIDISVIM